MATVTTKTRATRSRGAHKAQSPHGVWSSHGAFLFAAIGSVVWVNNLYQFPYYASQYGGTAFLLVYLFGLGLIGLPLLIAELLLGQRSRSSPPVGMVAIAKQAKLHPRWALFGWFSLAVGFVVFSYYSVIGGWALAGATRALLGALDGLTLDGISSLFTAFLRDPEKQLFWHALFLSLAAAVIWQGLHRGIERITRYVVPIIFVLLAVFLLYGSGLGGFGSGFSALLFPDFTRLTGVGVIVALGHAFFSLSLGVGAMFVYGARLPLDTRHGVARLAGMVVGADMIAALLAGLVLFPILAVAGLSAPSGIGVIFQEMPVAFDHLPIGGIMRFLFMVLIVLVAWTSVISFLEPVVLWLMERFELRRERAVIIATLAGWALGVVVILSFSYWSFSFKFFGVARTLGLFDVLLIVTHALVLVSALILSVLVGWKLHRSIDRDTLRIQSLCVYDVWLWSLRIVAPVLLLLILFNLPKLFL